MKISRRSFIAVMGAAVLSGILSGCKKAASSDASSPQSGSSEQSASAASYAEEGSGDYYDATEGIPQTSIILTSGTDMVYFAPPAGYKRDAENSNDGSVLYFADDSQSVVPASASLQILIVSGSIDSLLADACGNMTANPSEFTAAGEMLEVTLDNGYVMQYQMLNDVVNAAFYLMAFVTYTPTCGALYSYSCDGQDQETVYNALLAIAETVSYKSSVPTYASTSSADSATASPSASPAAF